MSICQLCVNNHFGINSITTCNCQCHVAIPQPPREDYPREKLGDTYCKKHNSNSDICPDCYKEVMGDLWEDEFNKKFRFKFDLKDTDDGIEVNGNWIFLRDFIQKTIQQERAKVIRELDSKYNKLCEEKVREERERIRKFFDVEIEGILRHGTLTPTGETILKVLREIRETI